MRNLVKITCVTLVLLSLALFSVGASPVAWGWLSQGDSSVTLEEQQEKLTPPSSTQTKPSTSSETTLGEVVIVKKADLAKAIAELESASAESKRAKTDIENAEKSAIGLASTAYDRLMRTRFLVKGNVGWTIENRIEIGLGVGVIFKDSILLEAEINKNNGFSAWDKMSDYTFRGSVGIVF